jgi:hypothetical protein
MDLQQAQTIEALAGAIGKIWPIVWASIGGVVSAISGLVGGAVFIRLLDRRVKATEAATTALQAKLEDHDDRNKRRLYYDDGQLIYTTIEACQRHRDACRQTVCAKVDELKALYQASETRDEARHQAITGALVDLAGRVGGAAK